MLPMLCSLVMNHMSHLTLAVLASPPPLDPTNLLTDIFNWLVKILSAVAMVFFVIDLFKHVASSPRDLGAAGTGALILIGLVVFELRCWGRSMREVVQILVRHVLRPHRLRLDVVMLTLPPEASTSASAGRPRWQT